jgi:hypothetical protein
VDLEDVLDAKRKKAQNILPDSKWDNFTTACDF